MTVITRAKEAFKVIASYNQERVDNLCRAICAAFYPLKVWGALCDETVNETGLGDKVSKLDKRNELRLILRDCLRNKTVGIIEENPAKMLVKYARPVGVIAAFIPATDPCFVTVSQALYAVKARDVLICSADKKAVKITNKTVNIIRDVLTREGATADIVQAADGQEFTEGADLVFTNDSASRNSLTIIDETINNKERLREAAVNTRISRCFDFGAGTSSNDNLAIHEKVYDEFLYELVKEGAYIPKWKEVEKLKRVIWDEEGQRLQDTVAISPQALAKRAGFSIQSELKFIAVPNNGQKTGFTIDNSDDIKKCIGPEHFFSRKKSTPLLTLFKYGGEFQTALEITSAIFNEAKGNCGLYSFDDEHIHSLGLCSAVERCLIRKARYEHDDNALNNYINTTLVERPVAEDVPSLKELFGEFYGEELEKE